MNYYKVTDKKEIHNGTKYKDGLNVYVLPWNPKGLHIYGYAEETVNIRKGSV